VSSAKTEAAIAHIISNKTLIATILLFINLPSLKKQGKIKTPSKATGTPFCNISLFSED
jgi:hypothetical protein